MKTKKLLTTLLLLFSFGIYAQNAIDFLIKQNKGNPQLVKELKEFKNSDIQKPFFFGDVTIDEFITQAKTYLGTPYKYAGYSKSGIDCSGFVSKTFNDLGVDITRSAQEMAKYGTIIVDKNELQAGDLIFFTKTYKTKNLISHAGIVLPDAKMIHASSSKGVSITNINNPYYWDKYYLFGTRIFDKDTEPILAAKPAETKLNTSANFKSNVIAAVYDVKFRGKYTDSGEKYMKGELTASHPTLPFGTLIKVTNQNNGKKITVRVNDGDTGRDEIDLTLSHKAARKLKLLRETKAEVKIEIIKMGK